MILGPDESITTSLAYNGTFVRNVWRAVMNADSEVSTYKADCLKAVNQFNSNEGSMSLSCFAVVKIDLVKPSHDDFYLRRWLKGMMCAAISRC